MLQKKIVIEAPLETLDEFGQPVVTWATFCEPFASIEPLRGREFFGAEQIQAHVDTRIRIRFEPGIHEKMRIRYEAEPGSPPTVIVYDVVSVIHVMERRRELQLMCVQRGADGFRA